VPRHPNRFAHERFTTVKVVLNALVVASFLGGWVLFDVTNDLGHDPGELPEPTITALPVSPTPTPSPPGSTPATPPGSGTPATATSPAEPTRTPTATPTRRTRAS
jgi:hypothetical protein